MSHHQIRIRASDAPWHARFFEHVAEVFGGGADFRLWAARGGWNATYEVLAIAIDDRLVSTIGRTRMELAINGEACIGYQLGAVATRTDFRRRGLSRQLMNWVIEELDHPDQPVILFANNDVLDFYPRFGFRRVRQQLFTASVTMKPAGALAPSWDVADAADRARLADHCVRAPAVGRRFAVREYYAILLWHLSNRPATIFRLDDVDAVVVASQQGERLTILDLLAVTPFDLRKALPHPIARPISEVEFRFHPEDWWPDVTISQPHEEDSPLFVRGTVLPRGPLRFPDLAQT